MDHKLGMEEKRQNNISHAVDSNTDDPSAILGDSMQRKTQGVQVLTVTVQSSPYCTQPHVRDVVVRTTVLI